MSDDAAPDDTGTPPQARVFISYSRMDMAFADRLESALKARGIEPLIDRSQIYAFEVWWERIETLIGRADTVVFVISPEAVASDVCRKEIAFAASLNKRFAPVVCRRADDKAVPEELARLNFIFFDDEARFEQSADKLAEALRTDIGWVRQHTDFGEQARRWASAKAPSGLLLRSPVLEQAERWIASRPTDAPVPTEETQTFITQSRQAAMRRRNVLTSSLAAGLVLALGLAAVAYWQRGVAVEQRGRAERTLTAATETANALVSDLAVRLRDAKGIPTSLVKDILDRARNLQDQLIGSGETSLELRRSQSKALNETATTLFTLGDANAALALAKQAEAILQDLLAIDPDNTEWQRALAASKSRIADALSRLGDPTDALAIYRDSLAILQALVAKDPNNTRWQSELAGVYSSLGDLLEAQGKSGEALTSYGEALRIRKMLVASEAGNKEWRRNLSGAYGSIGRLLLELGQIDEALSSASERLGIAEGLIEQDGGDPLAEWELYRAQMQMGAVRKAQGKFDESLAAFLESHRIMQALASADPEDTQRQVALRQSAERAGEILFIQRKLDEALAMYREASVIAKALTAKEAANVYWQRDLAVSVVLIGDVMRQQGKIDDALAAYRESKSIFERLAKQEPDSVHWQQNLSYLAYRIGDLLTRQRKFEEALAAYGDCLAITKELMAKEPRRLSWQHDHALCHAKMGGSLELQGKLDEALSHYRDARALFAAIVEKDDNNKWGQRDLAVADEQVGEVLAALGRLEEALVAFRDSFRLTKLLVANEPNNGGWQRDLVLIINRLANVLLQLEKPDEAVNYFDEPARFSADDVETLWNRGRASLYAERVAVAADDFAALVKFDPKNPYPVLWLHVARQRSEQDDKEEFEANVGKINPNKWPWPILALYSGRETADTVIAAAQASPAEDFQNRMCDVDFFVGVDRLAKGDRVAARRLLEAAVKDCKEDNFSRFAAPLELKRMDALEASQAKQ